MSERDELEITKLRTNFYATNYRHMVSVLLLMLIINFSLIGAIFYNIIDIPEPKYYANSQSGDITQIHSLSDPIMEQAEIIQWAKDLATTIYTFNFVNYNDVLQQLQKYFTEDGLTKLKNTLQSQETLAPIIANKVVVSSAINGLVRILAQGVNNNGRYVWKIQVPLLITKQSPDNTIKQPISLIMVITRTSTIDVAIDDITEINVPITN